MTTTMMRRNLRSNTRSAASEQSIYPSNAAIASSKGLSGKIIAELSASSKTTGEKKIAVVAADPPIVADDAVTANTEADAKDHVDQQASSEVLVLDRKYSTERLKKVTRKAGPENELTHLIPGYTAPMRLESKLSFVPHHQQSQQHHRQQEGVGIVNHIKNLSELRQRASRFELARYTPTTKTFLTSSSYRKSYSKMHDPTAGSGWFHMNPTPMTNQLKTDLSLLRNRNYLDPKKFYKSADSFDGKILQVGTVIEGSTEFYSSRLTKKERRQNITEELMADPSVRQYAKRKYLDIQAEKERSVSKKQGGRKQKGGRR